MKHNPFGESVPQGPIKDASPAKINEVNIAIENSQIVDHLRSGGSIQLVPKGSKGLIIKKEFNQDLLDKIEEITIELKSVGAIKIKTQDDAAKVNAVLKKAKALLSKGLENDRKLMTSVLDGEKVEIMNYERTISQPVQVLVDILNNACTEFQRDEDRKAKELQDKIDKEKREKIDAAQKETNRISGIKGLIIEFEGSVMNAIHSATIDDVDEKIKQLAGIKLTDESYMEFLPEAEIMYQSCVTKFNERKGELMRLAQAGKDTESLRLQMQQKQEREQQQQDQKAQDLQRESQDKLLEDASNIQMESELKTAMIPQAKSVQKPWIFDEEKIDMKLLPLEFHTFDKKKIKEAISSGAREIPGVEIFQDIRNVSK